MALTPSPTVGQRPHHQTHNRWPATGTPTLPHRQRTPKRTNISHKFWCRLATEFPFLRLVKSVSKCFHRLSVFLSIPYFPFLPFAIPFFCAAPFFVRAMEIPLLKHTMGAFWSRSGTVSDCNLQRNRGRKIRTERTKCMTRRQSLRVVLPQRHSSGALKSIWRTILTSKSCIMEGPGGVKMVQCRPGTPFL